MSEGKRIILLLCFVVIMLVLISIVAKESHKQEMELLERIEEKLEKQTGAGAATSSARSRAPRPTDMNGSSSSARRAPQQREDAPLRRPDGLKPSEEHTS